MTTVSTQSLHQEIEIADKYRERIYQFGSSNSSDIDYFVDLDLESEDTKEFRRELMKIKKTLKKYIAQQSSRLSEQDIDIQFIKIKDGEVVWAENKDPEETNNCLLNTFKNHAVNVNNYKECPVRHYLTQSVTLKAIKVIRMTLTLLSRTDYREDAKSLLNEGKFNERLKFIDELCTEGKFAKIYNFGKSQGIVEIYKDLAFYYAQLYAVMNDEHVFTKFDASVRYPDIAPYILRHEGISGEALQAFISEVINELFENLVFDEENDLVRSSNDESFYDNKAEKRIQ